MPLGGVFFMTLLGLKMSCHVAALMHFKAECAPKFLCPEAWHRCAKRLACLPFSLLYGYDLKTEKGYMLSARVSGQPNDEFL
jgi:hypothetical protein